MQTPPSPNDDPFFVPFMSSKSSIGEHLSSQGDDEACDIPEDIFMVLKAKCKLQSISPSNPDLDALLDHVRDYLRKHCDHCFIHDSIDLTPDRSMAIMYCKKCETTQ